MWRAQSRWLLRLLNALRSRVLLAALAVVAVLPGFASAQDDEPSRPTARASVTSAWLSVPLPPKAGSTRPVVIGSRGPRPVTVPPGDPTVPEFEGAGIRADLERIVAFAKESQSGREIGAGQLWGRISGFPSGEKTSAWAADAFRRAGIKDVSVQAIAQDPKASFWLPLAWQIKLLGDAAFGDGTTDLVLESAMPLSPSLIAGGALTAPLVYVGNGSPALAADIDVKGKIAVQFVVPQAHMVYERGRVVPQAQALFKRGAAAVLNVLRQPGNELARDFSNCGGPCFNVGGHDGHFLEAVFEKAASMRIADKLRATLTLQTDSRSGLQASNAVAVIPGSGSDEVVIVNAHYDGWFEGAGDNADGLAVLMALARHFARPDQRLRRTLALVASAGHHTPGINGPRAFVAANPSLAARAVMMINIEHVAQRNFSPARSVAADGYREAIADANEAPITPGVTNGSPFLDRLFDEGVARYGVNFVSDRSRMQSGETGGYAAITGAKLTVMQAPPLYHTTGETLGMISTPGLERMTRFLAYFVKEADKASAAQINP